MIRRPPRSTLFPLHDALPISGGELPQVGPADGLRRSAGGQPDRLGGGKRGGGPDRKSTRLNSSHANISYAVFCLKKKKEQHYHVYHYRPTEHTNALLSTTHAP